MTAALAHADRPQLSSPERGENTFGWRSEQPTEHLEAALDLARRGYAVFPLGVRSKVPMIAEKDGGHGYKDATRDEPQIREWWTRWPRANIGIATGALSGIFVVDVDPRDNGDKTLKALVERYGELPPTVAVGTGGGGWHLYFRHEPGLKYVTSLGPGVDVKSDGGSVVAPPSIHDKSGKAYRWGRDRHPDEVKIADAPEWLLQRATDPEPVVGTPTAVPPHEWRRLVVEGVAEPGRNVALTRLVGHLLRKGVDFVVVLEVAQVWNAMRCRPPLEPQEVERTVISIGERELERRGGGRD